MQCGRRVRSTRYVPPVCNPDLDRLTLKLLCESHVRSGIFIQNLSTRSLCVLELFIMYPTDRQMDGQTDRHTDKSNAYCPFPYGRGHNKEMKPSEMESYYLQSLTGSCIPIQHSEKWPWPLNLTLTYKSAGDCFPVYVTTKWKADICNSFQVIMWTHAHRPLPNESHMHVFMIIVQHSSLIQETSSPNNSVC